MTAEPLIELRGLTKTYGTGDAAFMALCASLLWQILTAAWDAFLASYEYPPPR